MKPWWVWDRAGDARRIEPLRDGLVLWIVGTFGAVAVALLTPTGSEELPGRLAAFGFAGWLFRLVLAVGGRLLVVAGLSRPGRDPAGRAG